MIESGAMSELSELEKRILSELAEFWRENFPALANATIGRSGKSDDLRAIQLAFESLVGADLAIVGIDHAYPSSLDQLSKAHSLRLLAEIEDHLLFTSEAGHWTGGQKPWPELAVTEAGLAEANRVLAELGERWWLPSN